MKFIDLPNLKLFNKSGGNLDDITDDSSRKRQKVLAGVAIFVILLYCYIAGIIGEILYNYHEYVKAGGLGSDAKLAKMDFGILASLKYLCTTDGIKAFLLLALVIALAWFFIRYYGKLFGKDFDERGFKKSQTGIYGTADWMNDKDVREKFDVCSVAKTKGLILGTKDNSIVAIPEDTSFNRHTFVFGASGAGKTTCFAASFVMQAIRRGESLAITDPKGELYSWFADMLVKSGYKVKVFNLVDPNHSDGWNCMSDLHGSDLLATKLCNIIIGNTGNGKGDPFFDNSENNLLKALMLLVENDPNLKPEEKNLASVYNKLTGVSQSDLTREFENLPTNHPARKPYNFFAEASENSKSSFYSGLGTRLSVLQNEVVQEMVSRNDINFLDLGEQKTAFFVITSDQDSSMKFLSSLFFSLLFIKLVAYADARPDHKCKIPVNLLLDEFNNIGRIGGEADGSDFARSLSTVRSRGIRINIIVQSLGQLQNRYPNNLWAEIVGNCDVQLLLGCTDDLTAKYISERSGEMTILAESTRHSRKTMALTQVVPEYTKTEGEGRRMLLTPDEVLRMDPYDCLVISRGNNVFKLKKYYYRDHPMAKRIFERNVYDYWPRGGVNPETGEVFEAKTLEDVVAEEEAAKKASNVTLAVEEPVPEITKEDTKLNLDEHQEEVSPEASFPSQETTDIKEDSEKVVDDVVDDEEEFSDFVSEKDSDEVPSFVPSSGKSETLASKLSVVQLEDEPLTAEEKEIIKSETESAPKKHHDRSNKPVMIDNEDNINSFFK